MFTQQTNSSTAPSLQVTSAPSAVTPSTAASATTPRASRLRGLNSYLRSYTQTHLLNRDHGAGPGPATAPLPSPCQQPVPPPPANACFAQGSLGPRHPDTAPTPGARPGLVSGSRSPLDDSARTPLAAKDAIAVTTVDKTMTRTRSATDAGLGQGGLASHGALDTLPSIRLSAFYDPRATRPSLTFAPVARTLPTGHEVIRVGRYSERDSQPSVPANVPSAAPVGFKSKVVSRRHCEFWYEGGKWYIKDVKSSSGTFLNHIRLSPPGTESKPFPVNDGDIVQLGIDFKGGEEMIFRCVKMRLELNRGWQNKLNAFNMTTHKRLRNMTKTTSDAGSAAQSSQDCSICLNSIAPCQCLFVAPCSHTWHYKCIRSLLSSPQYPIFICPNCRAAADLEAEVEDPEEWEQLESEDGHEEDVLGASLAEMQTQPPPGGREGRIGQPPPVMPLVQDPDPMDVTIQVDHSGLPPTRPESTARPTSHATAEPMPIPVAPGAVGRPGVTGPTAPAPKNERIVRTPSPTVANAAAPGHEGPITPRNDAGPWVFDGSGIRTRGIGRTSTDSRGGEPRDKASVEGSCPPG